MWDVFKKQFQAAVPFVNTLGIIVSDINSGSAEATLALTPELANHLGTLHAGAMFTLAETASGAAMTGALGAKVFELRAVAATSDISYKKLAKGVIRARAKTSIPAADINQTLEEEGKVRFAVNVELLDEADEIVALVNVDWHVSPKR